MAKANILAICRPNIWIFLSMQKHKSAETIFQGNACIESDELGGVYHVKYILFVNLYSFSNKFS